MKALTLFLIVSVFVTGKTYASRAMTKMRLRNIQENMRELSLNQAPSSEEREYFKFYGLNLVNDNHFFGKLNTKDHVIATHVFDNPQATKNVILLHGYYDSSGYMKNLIKPLLEKSYRVITFDLPGHGLSSGKPAEIHDFSQYAMALKNVLEFVKENFSGNIDFVGHSTGCATLIDYWQLGLGDDIGKAVFLAPLIRSKAYDISRWGHLLFSRNLRVVPRFLRKNSGDKDFLNFVKKDPLQYRWFPMIWLRALIKFNNRINAWEGRSGENLLVVQGTKDGTVEWKKNLPILEEKFPNVTINKIEDAEHQLQNESEDFRTLVFEKTFKFLD